MPQPVQYDFPVKRPGLIVAASWQGADSNLSLQLTYINEFGSQQVFLLKTSNANGIGDICLPSSADITNINRDAIIASVRMATMIGGTVPGSQEWLDAMTTGQATSNFQMAIGTVKLKEVRVVNDAQVEIDMVKNGTTNPVNTVTTDFDELGSYTFAPETQLRCVAGAIEKQYPSYVHNYPSQVLTQQQKDDIAAYVLTLSLWV